VADQGDITAAQVVAACVEAAHPDAVGEIVKAHAVGAADDQAGALDFARHALSQRRELVIRQHQAGHHGGGLRAVGDGRVQAGLDIGVTQGQHHVLDRFGQGVEGRKTGHAQDGRITGIDRVKAASVTSLEQVLDRAPSHGPWPFTGAEHRDGFRLQERLQPRIFHAIRH
jgi:hypothetical protein